MRRARTVLILLVSTGFMGVTGQILKPEPSPPSERRPVPERAVADAYGQLPLSFESTAAGFVARGPAYGLRVQPTGADLVVGTGGDKAPRSVQMRFAGGRAGAEGVGSDPLPGRVNHLTGDDPAGWRTDVPTYARVGFEGVYPGVDVVWYGRQGEVEYDLVVAPGADPGDVLLHFEGADDVRIDDNADLVLALGDESLLHRAPVAYQREGDRRVPVQASYAPRAAGRFGIELGAYDRSRTLVIDPVLAYSTFLGGTDSDEAYGVDVDASGSAYIVSYTYSSDFPTLNPLQQRAIDRDVVVSKLNPAGSALVYSTYLGGNGFEQARRVAVDTAGAAYLTGSTSSTDFPTQSALQPAYGGGQSDAYVTKLSPSGASLVYSTYLGGTGSDGGGGVAVDGSGNAYVGGSTASPDFPVVGPLQAALRGERDAFAAKLDATGSALVYSTYLGGGDREGANDVDIDSAGNAVLAGDTASTDFPLVNPVQTVLKNTYDGFVARLNPAGSALVYSTLLGGTGYVAGPLERESAAAVASDGAGNAYVTGLTTAGDFPTANALFPYTGNYYDAFITKLSPSGSLVYSTYLGSEGSEGATDIAIDSAGGAVIVGNTFGPVPLKDPIQPPRGGHDAFITKLNPSGTALEFSTHLGGDSEELAWGVAVDGAGSIYVVGGTQRGSLQPGGYEYPTVNAFQASRPGAMDGFAAKIALNVQAPAVAGSPWYVDGTNARSGPAGSPVSVYAVAAFQNVAYQLVLATDPRCAQLVAVLNPTTRFANASGFISTTRGTVPAGTSPGRYYVCFRPTDGSTATSTATFDVQ